MSAVVANEPSRVSARDVLRAVWIAAFGGSLPDGRKKNWRIGAALQAVMAVSVFNVAQVTLGAAVASELYVTDRAMCTIGRRGPHRSFRSRLGGAVPGAVQVVLMGLPGVVVGLVSNARTGSSGQAFWEGVAASGWALVVGILWTGLGLVVQFVRTHAYRHSYRDGVPKSHWLLGQAAALRGGDGFGFADSTAQQLVPLGDSTVTVARTRTLALIYAHAEFRPVREGKLVLVRP